MTPRLATRRAAQLLLGLLLSACVADPAPSEPAADAADATDAAPDTAADAAPAPVWLTDDPRPAVAWRPLAEVAIDASGLSERVALALPAEQRFVALRARPLDGGPPATAGLCLRLEPLETDAGQTLIDPPELQPPGEVCERCAQPVSSGHGDGLFVLSSAPEPLNTAQTLTFGLALRDCAHGVIASRARFPERPTRVALDVALEDAPPPGSRARLGVRVGHTPETVFGPGTLRDDPTFQAVWEATRARFAAIDIDLVLEATVALPPHGPLTYGPDDTSQLLALEDTLRAQLSRDASDTRFIPVAFVSCLRASHPDPARASQPLGASTRVPGGGGASPSLVLLAAGSCAAPSLPTPPHLAPWQPEHGGVLLAHELGHYLGLYHSDTPAGLPLSNSPDAALMIREIVNLADLDAAYFSPLQARVARRHPDVYFYDF